MKRYRIVIDESYRNNLWKLNDTREFGLKQCDRFYQNGFKLLWCGELSDLDLLLLKLSIPLYEVSLC